MKVLVRPSDGKVITINNEPIKADESTTPTYSGPYEFTSSNSADQTISIADKKAEYDITIKALPHTQTENYGKVTYNGYELTIS